MTDGLQNQIYLYSVETKDFYTDEEKEVSDKYFKVLRIKKYIKNKKDKTLENKNYFDKKADESKLTDEDVVVLNTIINKLMLYSNQITKLNGIANTYKLLLNETIDKFKGTRHLRSDALKSNKVISLFESNLTRTCDMKVKELTEDLFVIRVFHYQVLKSIIDNGYMYNDVHYEYFTSSAGQIRTKKIVCISSEVYKEYENAITCELTRKHINDKGGVNTNKYQAYLGLTNSASMQWNRFNIDRIVVVDDFSTIINAEVDYIDRDTYEITRQFKDIEIEHMDGCGIMLPTVSKKSFMFRLPWMKGLTVPFPFDKFAKLHGKTKITDIYGKEYDIVEDKINIILTKSQFKMWKYYDSWDDYKEKFKKHGCKASKLNMEDIGTDANLNYQMLQTLVSMTKDELTNIAQDTINDILSLGKDKSTMLRVLGATKENMKKTYFQKSLLLYPELLSDNHSREVIKSKKRSLIRDAKAGKLRVNGKYTFIIPDLYAFCEWLFLGETQPKGLLNNDEVYCNIFEDGKVDILRAPHLYKEHALRKNVRYEKLDEWFITKGVYTSCKDLISRILQFDNDGDKALVVQNDTLIEVAEREMEGVIPLFYEMTKAKDTQITNEKIYESLTSAYKANIGIISNDITKIWNSVEPNIDAVKWLTMYNNFVIDYAKTLFLPTPPPEAEETIKSFTKNKVPHFFKYAKKKEDNQIEPLNESTVNKLEEMIPDKPIRFKKVSGDLNYRDLMSDTSVEINEDIVNTFKELNRSKYFSMVGLDSYNSEINASKEIREFMVDLFKDEVYIVDVLVSYFYSIGNSNKTTLWDCFGNIMFQNLENNIGYTIHCDCCSNRVSKINETMIYCDDCSIIKKQESWRESKRRLRSPKSENVISSTLR